MGRTLKRGSNNEQILLHKPMDLMDGTGSKASSIYTHLGHFEGSQSVKRSSVKKLQSYWNGSPFWNESQCAETRNNGVDRHERFPLKEWHVVKGDAMFYPIEPALPPTELVMVEPVIPLREPMQMQPSIVERCPTPAIPKIESEVLKYVSIVCIEAQTPKFQPSWKRRLPSTPIIISKPEIEVEVLDPTYTTPLKAHYPKRRGAPICTCTRMNLVFGGETSMNSENIPTLTPGSVGHDVNESVPKNEIVCCSSFFPSRPLRLL
jgi:hypothetical protein